ncbi:MAG: phosphatase PAP2 family protein [Wenzhouxiangella sp.]
MTMALGALSGLAIYKALKAVLVRERPYISHADITCLTAPLDRYSFPSGHTLHAVFFAVMASAWFPILAPVLFLFAGLVALSRPLLGLHYPTDVLVGALIGWSLAEVMLAMFPPVMTG